METEAIKLTLEYIGSSENCWRLIGLIVNLLNQEMWQRSVGRWWEMVGYSAPLSSEPTYKRINRKEWLWRVFGAFPRIKMLAAPMPVNSICVYENCVGEKESWNWVRMMNYRSIWQSPIVGKELIFDKVVNYHYSSYHYSHVQCNLRLQAQFL